jgi:hypothetical protein
MDKKTKKVLTDTAKDVGKAAAVAAFIKLIKIIFK